MASDPKAAAALIIGKLKPSTAPGPAAPGMGEGEDMDQNKAIDMAAEDVFSAIESKDVALFKSAMKDFMALCDGDSGESDY